MEVARYGRAKPGPNQINLLIDRCASLKIHIFTPSDPDCEIRKGAMILETFN